MKLELNVIRMTNEDVIATSGVQVCNAHADAAHLYTCSDCYNFGSIQYINAYRYFAGEVTHDSSSYSPINVAQFDVNVNPEKDKWYYYDPSTEEYNVCNGNHSGYTTPSN